MSFSKNIKTKKYSYFHFYYWKKLSDWGFDINKWSDETDNDFSIKIGPLHFIWTTLPF